MTHHPSTQTDGNKKFGPPPLPANWSNMSGEEKYDHLSIAWASTKTRSFASAEIEETYRRRARRWLDVVALKKPDRVPDYFLNGEYSLNYADCKPSDRFYHQKNAARAAYIFHRDFGISYSSLGVLASGKALDSLGYQIASWPGSTLTSYSENMQFQYVEKEYMQAQDYDDLIADPEGYALYKISSANLPWTVILGYGTQSL